MEQGKLYYQDCHLKTFQATVLACEHTEKGYEVLLDQTAFYPEGGGQACDTGTLDAVRVLDVRERQEQVVHYCDGPLTVGQRVTGTIDWDRRFDLMQQHTGEHLLSGLIHDRFGYHNSGFHVGAQVMEVDFDGPIDPQALSELEQQANALVWANLPVNCFYPSPEELPTIGYRTKRELPWPVRIVQIPGGDTCACCGVHVGSTGEVGLIKILSCVKFHGGVRLEMVCGSRAYRYIRDVFDQNRKVSQLLSAKVLETATAVEKLQQSFHAEKFRATGLEKQVFDAIAESYRDAGFALCFQPGLDGGSVRELANRIASVCGGIAAVLSGSDEEGYSICLASTGEDVRPLGQATVQALNGRGGGKPGAFQGTLRATKGEIETFFKQ
ncbi:MAG: alanyl-tRNA editing protein [Oscillospiraceae bacterium]|nr:alanyl-tRNA editing protein [Oscillospiraceae bacterium]